MRAALWWRTPHSRASGSQMLVLTDDLQLHLALVNRGVDSINFNHLRTFFWHS
jgi:hypothetical protein